MKLAAITFLLFSTTIICGQTKSKIVRKTNIDITTVDYVKIGRHLKKPKVIPDSSWSIEYKNIDGEQIKYIVDQFNGSEFIGEKKLKPKYSLDFYFKDGTKKTIKISDGLNEIKNYWFQPKDEKYFNKLWANTN